ncbi:DNA-binding response OmpR family regulator [Mucilaginibacter sp. SG538B]|uniref:response regulator transcription factor n=1 Tax=Mucilaginibacter sp. SG538B TaxID=2587021 RepID=UPI00159E5CBB|nr:response regulator transcription factor [Mucilaginibacter sp. SG538B]NVM64643.1 DNA-binding response OmpR family regulator [Mucilaginibacter sp. SG538B]
MISHKVLLVEDEPVLAEIVQESLQSRGFEVVYADTIARAKGVYYDNKPDIIVLDVMLPDGSGFDFARQIRNVDTDLPVIFLTSRSLPQDVVEGFESGGNDYLKKPFSLEELIIRIRALLSKNRLVISQNVGLTEIGRYRFYYPQGELNFDGNSRTLTTRESEILNLLIMNRNQLLNRDELLLNFWQNNDYFSSRSLDVFITKLRRYLKDDPSVSILNIRGRGYKLIY